MSLPLGLSGTLRPVIGATGAVQLVLAELDGRGHLIQHLVQDSLQLQAAQLRELLVHIPAQIPKLALSGSASPTWGKGVLS